jgi:hypothetical protein
MIIYVNEKLDQTIMRRLYSIANTYKIELQQKTQKEAFELPNEYKSNFRALNCLDAMTSIYKGLEKLKDFQTI